MHRLLSLEHKVKRGSVACFWLPLTGIWSAQCHLCLFRVKTVCRPSLYHQVMLMQHHSLKVRKGHCIVWIINCVTYAVSCLKCSFHQVMNVIVVSQ